VICGVLAALVLLAGGWFLVIAPKYEERDGLRAQTATASGQRTALNRRIAELERQRDDLDQFQATLAEDRKALPETAELSEFLRQVQSAGSETAVAVSGLLVGSAAKIPNTTTEIFALPITMTAVGTAEGLGQFLDQIQRVRPRAVLVSGVNVVAEGQSTSLTQASTLTLSVRVFVAPASAQASPPAS
jgi:Tfp pilus assembly protein PilO